MIIIITALFAISLIAAVVCLSVSGFEDTTLLGISALLFFLCIPLAVVMCSMDSVPKNKLVEKGMAIYTVNPSNGVTDFVLLPCK